MTTRPDPYGGARVGHGAGCVALTLDGRGGKAAALLTPGQARALARRLHRQAGHAEQAACETEMGA